MPKRHHAGKRQVAHRRHSRLGLRADHVRPDISGFAEDAGAMMGNNLKAHLEA
jgi:hypothetical protein